MRRLKEAQWTAAMLVSLLGATAASAAEPHSMQLQGLLTSAGGSPVDGVYDLTVTFYDTDSGGTKLHSELVDNVEVVDGLFQLRIGVATPLPDGLFADHPNTWMSFKVAGEPEMSLVSIAAVPYAFVAAMAHDLACEGCVASADIADGGVSLTKLAACGDGKLLKMAGGAWACADDAGGPTYAPADGVTIVANAIGVDVAWMDAGYVNAGEANAVTSAMIAPGAVTAKTLGEPCKTGEVLKKTATGWACAEDDNTGSIYTGTAGVTLSGNAFSLDVAYSDTLYIPRDEANSITGAMVVDGSLGFVDISGKGCSDGQLMRWSGTKWECATLALTKGTVTDVTAGAGLSGGTITTSGTLAIASGGVTSAMLADGAVTNVKVASGIAYSKLSGAPTSLPPSGTAGGDLTGSYPNPTVAALAINTTELADGAVTNAKVANGIAYAKLSGAPTSLPPSGTAGGDLTGSYPNPTVAALAINTAELADGAVTNAKVANGIAYAKLSGTPTSLPPSGSAGGDLSGTYPNPAIAGSAITAAKIANGAVTAAKIGEPCANGQVLMKTSTGWSCGEVTGVVPSYVQADSGWFPAPMGGASATTVPISLGTTEPDIVLAWGRGHGEFSGQITLPMLYAGARNYAMPGYVKGVNGTYSVRGGANYFATINNLGDRDNVTLRGGDVRLVGIKRTANYDSGWFSCGGPNNYNQLHGVGSVPEVVTLEVSQDATGKGSWRIPMMSANNLDPSGNWSQAAIVAITSTGISVRTHGTLGDFYDASGTVQESMSAYCRLKAFDWTPDYDSGWVSISTAVGNRDKWFQHKLGKFPSFVYAYVAGNTTNTSWVLPAMGNYHYNYPESVGIYDVNERYIVVKGGSSNVARYVDSTGAGKTPTSGYVRVMAWY